MIVIGASLGGLQALQTIFRALPADFPSPVAVVLHRDKDSDPSLRDLLQRDCAVPLVEAVDKEPVASGTVFIAPPDYHLLVEPDNFSLSTDDPVCCARPSIDVLFESAADVLGAEVIAVVLTGASNDGAAGAARVERAGGSVLVQDPRGAECPIMPAAAVAATRNPVVVALPDLGAKLVEMAARKSPTATPSH